MSVPILRLARLPDYLLALVWATMGLYCKILGQVPRHEAIVADVLGHSIARPATVLIGLGEVAFAVWIATGYRRRLSAGLQIALVLVMNVLELVYAKGHLLWGPLNFVFALGFCLFVYWNGFLLHRPSHAHAT